MKMNSHTGRIMFVVTGVMATCCNIPLQAQTARPNVLFVAVDDLNDWISVCGGHPKAKTPHLERLAAHGAMVFQNAHCAGPVCCPSRSAMQRLARLLPAAFAEPIPYSKGKYKKVRTLDETIKAARDLAALE